MARVISLYLSSLSRFFWYRMHEAHMIFFLTKKVRRDQTEYAADAQTSKISNIVMLKMLLARRAW